ncbi:MAG: glutathione S-transferase family protein [Alkalilacustris sp.]
MSTLYINLTSPYARLVRVAVVEKGLGGRITEQVVDPWSGEAGFVRASVHERVPALVTDDGHAISESGLILTWLERMAPTPALFPTQGLAAVLQRAAHALGAIDVSAAIIISRKSAPDFDSHFMGQKRFRTLAAALDRLEADPPADLDQSPDIAALATAVALDYAAFRFPDRDWLGARPRLAAWRAAQAGRASLDATMPRE